MRHGRAVREADRDWRGGAGGREAGTGSSTARGCAMQKRTPRALRLQAIWVAAELDSRGRARTHGPRHARMWGRPAGLLARAPQTRRHPLLLLPRTTTNHEVFIFYISPVSFS
jgi:hypothetical protein